MKTLTETKKATHTPGPWKAHFNVPTAVIPGHIIKKDDAVARPIASLWEGGGTKGKPEQIANARLIAAAPELLSAAQKAWALLEDLRTSNPGYLAKLALQDYANLNEALMELPAAIAKATA